MVNLRKDQGHGEDFKDRARNARQNMDLTANASSRSTGSQIGTSLLTATETKGLENTSTYLFRAEIGGLVKVYVGRKNLKYVVLIEISSLPQWADESDLVVKWGIFRSDSSSFMPFDPQMSSTRTESNSFQTPLIKKGQNMLFSRIEFGLDQAPFYLSFLLKSQSNDPESNLEIRSHRKTNFCVPVGIRSGHPAPLGISFSNDGSVNFALFSKNSESVILCLYDGKADKNKPSLEIALDPYINRTGDIWHVLMESVWPYVAYGYRCNETSSNGQGDVVHPKQVLLDPYSKILGSLLSDRTAAFSPMNCIGNLSEVPAFDWSDEKHPCLRLENLVVYRLNVQRFTEDKSSQLPTGVAGTFSGLIEKLVHFKVLRVNAILLEPIFPFDEQKGPYFPFHFFSPMNLYGPIHDSLSAINSMKEMVKKLHANGLEVLLEVVYTHTTDDGGSASHTVGLQGIDYYSYYHFGCGVASGSKGALNCNNPVVQQMILDSLRYWVTEFHIDGFCFVNASSLVGRVDGDYLPRPALIEAIAFDPLLSKAKIIADCLDPNDASFKEVRFPHWKRWAEMNPRFCRDVRNFLRGEGLLSDLATRLCGSGDVFSDGRGPAYSFNFVSRNFGLSIVDLVSFGDSELSSELSWNCGEEGSTNKVNVLETRLKQIRNFFFILFVSLGVPVINMGDECGQSCNGSPLYKDKKPFDWEALRMNFGVQLTQFVAFLSSFRMRRRRLFQSRDFLEEDNIDWLGSDLTQPRWEDKSSKFLAMTLRENNKVSESNSDSSHEEGDLFIAFNASDQSESVILPPPSKDVAWFRLVDTALTFPGFFSTNGELVVEQAAELLAYEMKSHSCALFEARRSIS
ncbi:hypothetical protein Scep_009292 [Stephania cephalantha]|uniref:Glycosyl hydrolase family 13 catalytic domain-containing protein n=1 Tax=Stephania cephalantha TaxID=152367 RepID=A0AAP0JSV0_9MAGN